MATSLALCCLPTVSLCLPQDELPEDGGSSFSPPGMSRARWLTEVKRLHLTLSPGSTTP